MTFKIFNTSVGTPVHHRRNVCIIQPGYLPWLGYFDLVSRADVFVLYDDVQFDSGSWRNRNRILGSGGPVWLTVPVFRTKHFGQLIKDVRIADSHWQEKHLRSIRHSYSRAPYFESFFPAINFYLTQRRYDWLIDLNLAGHEIMSKLIGLPVNIKLSSSIRYAGKSRTARLVSICSELGATRYIACDSSANYMEPELWEEANISLTYQHYPHPVYKQWNNPFVGYLSALDALMFCGKTCASYLGFGHERIRTGISNPL